MKATHVSNEDDVMQEAARLIVAYRLTEAHPEEAAQYHAEAMAWLRTFPVEQSR